MTKHSCPGLEVHEVFAVIGADTLFCVTATVDSRFPDFQLLNLWPRRACQDVAGTLEVDVLYFSTLELLILLCVKRQQVNKHCHQHCYWELEDLGFCPDPQCKLTTLHPKWTYVLCLLIAESSPGPCDDLPSASPSACRTDTWISVHGDSYHLTTEEDTIPVDHCDPRSIQPSWCDLYLHSCSSLPRFSTALYSAVKSLQAK